MKRHSDKRRWAPWAAAWTVALLGAAAAGDSAPLQIYLPRETTVEDQPLRLSAICIIRGQDAALVAKAEQVAMGRVPLPGEQIAVERSTILGRLASQGVSAAQVRFTGAFGVLIRQREKIFTGEQLLQAASEFVQAKYPPVAGSFWQAVQPASAMSVPAVQGIVLSPSLGPGAPPGQVRVDLAALADGRVLARTQVVLQRMYLCRRVVATQKIPAGTALSRENVRIETAPAQRPEPLQWQEPLGMIAVRNFAPGTVIPPEMLQPQRPAVLIRRDQRVKMRIEAPGFVMAAAGQALEDGRFGQLIRVRNIDTGRVVSARVNVDGTVQPMIEENSQ